MENFNILDSSQYEFRIDESTNTEWISFFESTVDSMDNREETNRIFIDLSKAFESVF